MMIMFTAFIVGVFYCLDALHGERRDRSILFWKSLPVSDLTTVLSKAIIPLVVLPLLTFAIIIATQLIMLLMSTAVLLPAVWRGTTWATAAHVSTVVGSALRPDHAGALARANLRLAAAGLRLGAARDVPLGGVTVACGLQSLRRSRSTQRISPTCLATVCSATLRMRLSQPGRRMVACPHRRSSQPARSVEISEQSGPLVGCVIGAVFFAASSPLTPLSRTALIHALKNENNHRKTH